MELIFVLVAIIQIFSISLGVGSSTLAVTNFFVAIADGKIDETERKMMGIAYIILRIAMVTILITTSILFARAYLTHGLASISTLMIAELTMIAMLYINASLMTLHIMPSTVGPAFQAASWYALGALYALLALQIANFTYVQFLLGFAADCALNVTITNGLMWYFKSKRAKQTPAS
jgi:hypothetical protein